MPGLNAIGTEAIGTDGVEAILLISPNDLSHNHTLEIITLTENQDFTINELSHQHTLETITFSQVHNLDPNELSHNHPLDPSFLLVDLADIQNPPSQDKIERAQFGLRSQTGRTESPFTLKEKTFSYHGERWEGEFKVIPLDHFEIPEWKAWLAILEGRNRGFRLDAPHGPRGNVIQNGTIKSVTKPRELGLQGLSGNVTDVFKAGDYIQTVETDQLFMVQKAVNTNGLGETTVTVQPKIRKKPSVNSAVETQQPQGLFHLDVNDPGWQEQGTFNELSFSFVETVKTEDTI